MTAAAARRASERRAEKLLNDLLISHGWDLRRPPHGNLLLQNEYREHPDLMTALAAASKSGTGAGIPEAVLVDRLSADPLAVVETKRSASEIGRALAEAEHYARALVAQGYQPLAIGLAGWDEDHALRVSKWSGQGWSAVTYDGSPITWIPSREDVERVARPSASSELRPSIPRPEVLADRADEINRLLRESNVIDQLRPAVVAAVMLGLWQSKGNIRRDRANILRDINVACMEAFVQAGKRDLAKSLRIDEANDRLAARAKRIAIILERLNVTVLTAEHDYLGQLYEAFFRYTGGNTIGQYFTPRHIAKMMCDLCQITKDDIILDPACGSGGFLVSAMDRILREHNLSRRQMVEIVKHSLIGFESEPVTAALCVANMILRGDGSTGIHRADCFTSSRYPLGGAAVALMNPPFPHKKTDTPTERFVDRALEGLHDRGKLAVILPTSLLVKAGKGTWREKILKKNSLLAVCQLPDELFQPFASATTSFALIEKGVPHSQRRKTTFVRLHHDGLALRKGVRVARESEPNQIQPAIDAILNGTSVPGFSGRATVSGRVEWAPGAYIASAPADERDVGQAVDVLIRRLASFYTRYAPEVLEQRRAVTAGEIKLVEYRAEVSGQKLKNAKAIQGAEDEIGGRFDILYGLGEIESREGMSPGRTLVVSPTEQYNGCYGWLEFQTVLRPPFITVARTGSIGEAFVHIEPCAPNSDCLVLLPRCEEWGTIPELFLAASAIRLERWRYNYGRKITPSRLAGVKLSYSQSLKAHIAELWGRFEKVVNASLAPYQATGIAPDSGELGEEDAAPNGLQAAPPDDRERALFRELAEQWRRDRPRSSSATRMASHPAYVKIIDMGPRAIPLLLLELRDRPDHWFAALHAVTGENPVPEESRGRLPQMAAAWIAWGERNGYI